MEREGKKDEEKLVLPWTPGSGGVIGLDWLLGTVAYTSTILLSWMTTIVS